MDKDMEQILYEKELERKEAAVNRSALVHFLKMEKERQVPTGAGEPRPGRIITQDGRTMGVRRSVINDYDGLAIERIIHHSDLFPIAYLQMGLNASRPVCRLSLRSRSGRLAGYGTGFMVSPSLLLTNNHVLIDEELALYSVAEFNHEDDEHFMPRAVDSFRLDPTRFFLTDEELDYTLVAVHPVANTRKALSEYGYLPILPQPGKILEGEYVSIIQHPQGGPKAVTLRENQVRFLSGDFIHYLTDTEPGSSGSPVFNDQWVVVALHHAGVPDPDSPGDWIANEGIRMSSIDRHARSLRHTLSEEAQELLDEALDGATGPAGPVLPETESTEEQEFFWYDGVRGYDENFLGKEYPVPLPVLKEKLEGDIAITKDGEKVLHYSNFSIQMSRSRRLAFYSAVNIDGSDRRKLSRSNDRWYFDPRISRDHQSGPSLYSSNELDRGHLVRRLDPVWGEDAARANEDTFHYTNCLPQHRSFNRISWRSLEDYILRNTSLHGMRISVFTGPVFRADDMMYRGEYKIPAEFWKVVVMVKTDGALSATAYLQTQKNLLQDLEFAFGSYKTFQVPLAGVEELTDLDFGMLKSHDPLAGIESFQALLIENEESLRL